MSPQLKQGMTFTYVITFIIAFLGNSVGLHAVRMSSSVYNPITTLLIANMAAADLMTTLSIIPHSVLYMYIEDLWFGGLAGTLTCKVVQYAMVVPISASVLTLLSISFVRFQTVFQLQLGRRLISRPWNLTVVIWVSSMLLMSFNLLLFQSVQDPDGRYYCIQHLSWGDTDHVLKVFAILHFLFLYALPLLLMIIMYTLIGQTLWQNPEITTEETRATRGRLKRRVIKLLLVITVLFALLWFPAHLMHFLASFKPEFRVPVSVAMVSFWLAHVNCAVHPCLYIALNGTFRRDFLRTLSQIPGNVVKLFRACQVWDWFQHSVSSDNQNIELDCLEVHLRVLPGNVQAR